MDGIAKGWKTTEFWLSAIAMVVGTLLTSGLIPTGGVWGQIIGLISTVLAAIGYTAGRSSLKKAETVANAATVVAEKKQATG